MGVIFFPVAVVAEPLGVSSSLVFVVLSAGPGSCEPGLCSVGLRSVAFGCWGLVRRDLADVVLCLDAGGCYRMFGVFLWFCSAGVVAGFGGR